MRREKACRKHFSETGVRGVADREPEYLRRRAKLFKQAHEIAILGQYNRVGIACGEEDLAVSGIA